jgi:hypothetical protein
LEEGVTLAIGGMVLPIFFVIPWMALAPLTLAVRLVGLVVRVDRELFFLPSAFTGALAVCLTAIELILYMGIRLKKAFAMRGRTLNLCVHGFPPVGEKP